MARGVVLLFIYKTFYHFRLATTVCIRAVELSQCVPEATGMVRLFTLRACATLYYFRHLSVPLLVYSKTKKARSLDTATFPCHKRNDVVYLSSPGVRGNHRMLTALPWMEFPLSKAKCKDAIGPLSAPGLLQSCRISHLRNCVAIRKSPNKYTNT